MPSNFLSDPLWYKDAVIYELHVRSFFDSNNDGYGDFEGMIRKLPYLESLGINTIWLLPFLRSPLRDDGYDISDYYRVLQVHGDLHDFKRLLDEAHGRGMRVITELVLNHTSDQHPWFQEARDPNSPKHDWYVWSDTPEKYQEARIIFTDTEVSNWTWDPKAQKYYWHRFFSHQPDLNYENPEVREAMKDVMFFWFDLGVDGLRLDAVPYLFEREGTNCENLPETLDFIYELRNEVDKRYGPGKVLLAEANQWPEDTLPYFYDVNPETNGQSVRRGVQMAFNFPIMPRMYMALRRENRRPMLEMLELTKDIPDDAQWAIFLRNHDELTLEMVTDEERDYMYHEYGADTRFRINVGIRRRLAPLLGGERRRIELMNALLLSLKGSPIIYYGDEIGMGDDPFLGDRDGVRTPMQWSADKHGGFSRAPRHRLFMPPISHGQYGFETVNVEDSENDPHSLLSFMKRLLTLRRQHEQLFGRGSLEVIPVENERILAFVREYEGDKILVLANLSRYAQSAYLPPSPLYEGLVPVELMGQTPFPKIDSEPFHLLLGPHAWHWFALKDPDEITLEEEKVEAATMNGLPESLRTQLPVLRVREGLQNLLVRTLVHDRAMDRLEAILPDFLRDQRWFGGKEREIDSVDLADAVRLQARPPVYLSMVTVSFTNGDRERYLLPLTVASARNARQIIEEHKHATIAWIDGPDGRSLLFDATIKPEFWITLFQWWQTGTKGRSLRGLYISNIDKDIKRVTVEEAQPLGLEQTNSSAFIDRRFYVKLYRRLEEGRNPEAELLEHLTSVNFEFVPRMYGTLHFRQIARQIDIGILQKALPVETDGWTYARAMIGRYLDRVDDMPEPVAATDDVPPDDVPAWLEDVGSEVLSLCSVLGIRTAEMHQGMAKAEDYFMKPVEGRPDDAQRLAEMLRNEQTMTRRLLESQREEHDLPLHELEWDNLDLLLRVLETIEMTALRIRVHGDYHLGQVIRSTGEYYILDFEGEPSRSIEERRQRDYAVRDVAGMLRSIEYATYFAWQERTDANLSMETWVNNLSYWCQHSFLDAYYSTVSDAPFVLPPSTRDAILQAYLLRKALYEVRYELSHRPKWVWLPFKGLRRLLSGIALVTESSHPSLQ